MIFLKSKGSKKNRGRSKFFRPLFFSVGLAFIMSGTCLAYIMPAEQLIQFMAANFSSLETVILTQFVQQVIHSPENDEGISEIKLLKEQIWMKSPDFYRTKLSDEEAKRIALPDVTFRQLLISNGEQRLSQVLLGMGIDLKQVALTRIEGVIAYRIGDRDPEGPKILIEKERFLPLLVQYRSSEIHGGKITTIRYRDYQRVGQGWYPFEIIYSSEFMTNEIYTIIDITPNAPIDPSIFSAPGPESDTGEKREEDQGLSDKERLRQIIKKFEEKYR